MNFQLIDGESGAADGTAAAADADNRSGRCCFHCSEPIPAGLDLRVRIHGRDEPMCCRGCQAVAQAIVDYGLERYYRIRSEDPSRPEPLVPEELQRQALFDDPLLQSRFTDVSAGTDRTAALILEGITCPACCWLIEQRLSRLPGMKTVNVNYTTQRASVTWDSQRLRLSEILSAVSRLGYRAEPYTASLQQHSLELERRLHMRRIGVAGLLGMQVMMISMSLYFGDWWGMQEIYRRFFYAVAMLLTLPVLIYSGQPFFLGAWRDLRVMRPGMDVPVALGISVAFAGSALTTFTGRGQVYYDSVVMFVFILLMGRYIEFSVRRHTAWQLDRLQRVVPAVALRLNGAEPEPVPATALRPGDRVLVRPGETVPADGVIVEGSTTVNESLITGEARPVSRGVDDAVIGGSVNVESPIHFAVSRVGKDTLLAAISRLVEACQSRKPAIVRFTSQVGTWFVAGVLILAAVVAWYWHQHDPRAWIPVTVSLLVITCPCALALAAPTAFAAAASALMKCGVIPVNADALEVLARANWFVFDKTGTLTVGQPQLTTITPLGGGKSETMLLLAAALERSSEHPWGKAIVRAAGGNNPAVANNVRNFPGAGLIGEIDGREYALGSPGFVEEWLGDGYRAPETGVASGQGGTQFYLADRKAVLAVFSLEDPPQPEAPSLITDLHAAGVRTMILSGDSTRQTERAAKQLNMDTACGGQTPDGKVRVVRELLSKGETVCMVGDGVNDAPVLAAASVSAAMGTASDLAQASADMILPGGLNSLRRAYAIARRAMRVIRQNLVWALAYNLLAIPLAAGGHVAPWMAALGMSVSSVLVVLNSARLGRAG